MDQKSEVNDGLQTRLDRKIRLQGLTVGLLGVGFFCLLKLHGDRLLQISLNKRSMI